MLMMMLHWFFLVSGLKVNVHKSSLYRLGVHYSDIQSMANSFGCLANNLSFTYLDVKVAANMARINSWNKVIQKVIIKLSNWKAKSLSVGGRLTLLKSVLGSLPTYYISLFKAPDGVLSHLERVRSSFFLGAEMDERKMTWIWLFCLLNKVSGLASSKLFTVLMALLISLPRHLRKSSKIKTLRSLFEDVLDVVLKSQFQELSLSLLFSSVVLSSFSDRWSWTLNGHGDFSVKSAREEIDKHLLVPSSSSTRLSKLLPIKLNVFAWRMFLDKLRTRFNLSSRGLDVPCVLCPICGNAVESRNNLFFGCSVALDLFRLLGRWWNIDIINLIDHFSWESWFNGVWLNNL
ncbi:RNA-directed DNA polymerase, eukaryota, reverse transcriptase zinc-binding domain protein [Tanacetum coccineum]